MRRLQRHAPTRLLVALVAGALVPGVLATCGAVHPMSSASADRIALLGLFASFAALAYAALTVAPDAIALQRRHYWRWWWRSSTDQGPFWAGTRIPRRPS